MMPVTWSTNTAGSRVPISWSTLRTNCELKLFLTSHEWNNTSNSYSLQWTWKGNLLRRGAVREEPGRSLGDLGRKALRQDPQLLPMGGLRPAIPSKLSPLADTFL